MSGSPSSESAETPLTGERRGVFTGPGQPTSYGSSRQSTVTFATFGRDLHSDDLTSLHGSGAEQTIADVEANGMDEPGKVRGGSKDVEDLLTDRILALTLPALVSLSVDPLMSAIDTVYVGKLDPELGGGVAGLGALSINTNVFYIAFLTFGFLAIIPAPFVASARARGDETGASRLVGQLLMSALIMGSVLMIVLEIAGPAIVRFMGATPHNEVQALSYLRARATSAPAALLINVGNGAFRGFLDTKTPLLILLGATAVNFTLDPILIFAAGLGMRGAAIATVAAEWSGALTFLYLLSRKEPAITPRRPSMPDSAEGWTEARKVVTSSAAIITQALALQVVIFVTTVSAARIGDIGIAAHQVASQVWMVLGFMIDSIAIAAQGLVADRIGAGSIVQARFVARKGLAIGVWSGVAALAVVGLLRRSLPAIFTSNEEVLSAVAPVMWVVAILQPFNGYVFVGDGVLQGSQDFVYEALSMLLSSSIGTAYILFCMSSGPGSGSYTLVNVWVGMLILLCSRALTFTFRHFLDPRGPLALKSSSVGGNGGHGKAGTAEDAS